MCDKGSDSISVTAGQGHWKLFELGLMNQRMESALNRPCLRKWDGGAEPQWNGALPGRKRSDLV